MIRAHLLREDTIERVADALRARHDLNPNAAQHSPLQRPRDEFGECPVLTNAAIARTAAIRALREAADAIEEAHA